MLVATAAGPACTALGRRLAAAKDHTVAWRAARPPFEARRHLPALEQTCCLPLLPLLLPPQCPRRRNPSPPVAASSSRSGRPSSQGTTPAPNQQLSFDVTSPDDYNHFERNWVQRMRQELRDPENPTVTVAAQEENEADPTVTVAPEHQIARLRRQVLDNPEFMEVTLRAGHDAVVTLRLRTDTLWVVGFRNRAGAWFEFRHDEGSGGRPRGPMIQGSTTLPFNGSYLSGSGIGDLDELQRQHSNVLGRQAAVNAIYNLARYDNQRSNRDETRFSLLTLIVNFIESVRFRTIAERVGRAMMMSDPSQEYRQQLSEENVRDIRNWGRMSTRVMMGLSDLAGASTVLGMALVSTLCETTTSLRRRPRAAGAGTCATGGGIVLAEVIGVLIKRINDCDPGRLYGTISITESVGTHQLFDRDDSNTQEVGPGGLVDLAWPPRPISGDDGFVVSVDLTDHYRLVGKFKDRKVAFGEAAWNPREAVAGDYNRIIPVEVKAEYGEVAVQYAVLTDAVVADVEVVVVDNDSWWGGPDVYGSISATTTAASGESFTYKLFEKEAKHYVSTPKETPIPLQRKVVSAALGTPLRIDVDLSDDRFLGDAKIAHGYKLFAPSVTGSQSEEITGAHGRVRVTVTWSIY